jgi:pimeloyl-ACP methyl ester carboxylesterase
VLDAVRDRLADALSDRRAWLFLAVLAVACGGVLGTLTARALSGSHAAAKAAAAPPPTRATAPATAPVAPPAPPPTTVTVSVVVTVHKVVIPPPTRQTPKPTTPKPGGLPYATLPLPAPTPAGAREVLRELQQLPLSRLQAFDYTTHVGVSRRVVLLYPRHPGNQPLPLVIAIHGRGGDPAHTCGFWGDLAGYAHVVVACPQGQGNVLERYSWGAPGQIDDLARMPALVQKVVPQLTIDRSRIFAVGASMGGMETLLLIGRHPGLLRAAVAIDPVTDLAQRYWQLRTTRSGLVTDARMRQEMGGDPDQAPIAYLLRSPQTLIPRIAASNTALAVWYSADDQIVAHQGNTQAGLFVRSLARADPRRPLWQRTGVWQHSWPYRHELWRVLTFFGLLSPQGFPAPRGHTRQLAPGWEGTDR